jgi:GST-like protein
VIDLHYWPTPNGWKISIMLEEVGLKYRTLAVDIGAGDQFKPEFLRISPNNRMPAIVDHEPLGGGAPLAIFESGAILEYLADKSGQFLARSGPARYATLQWLHWQMANLGPMMGNANHFKNYAKQLVSDPAQLAYGVKRFTGEVDRLFGVLDAQLSARRYVAGAEYTIADIAAWPWVQLVVRLIDENAWTHFPHVKRWVDEIGARPGVQRGHLHHKEWGEQTFTEEEQKRRRELLFNQTNEKVRAAREAAAQAPR